MQNKLLISFRANTALIYLVFIFISCQSSKPASAVSVGQSENQKALKNDPNPEALKFFMNGQMLMNQGDFPMAIIEFQEALALDPNVGTIYTSIAECYWNIGKSELSMKNLKIALSKNPSDEEALRIMADQLIVMKKYDEAIKPFKKLRDIDKEETRYIIALAEISKLKKNYLEAVNLYLEAYEIEPSRIELLESAGRYALQLKNKDQAKTIFKNLSTQNPSQGNYLNIYSELAIQSKSFNEAILHIKKLISENGDSSDFQAKLGVYTMHLENQK